MSKYAEAQHKWQCEFIKAEFAKADGCVSAMARNLGLHRGHAYRLLRRVGMRVRDRSRQVVQRKAAWRALKSWAAGSPEARA